MWGFSHLRTSGEVAGKFPGYLSPSAGLKFADVPNGLAALSKAQKGPSRATRSFHGPESSARHVLVWKKRDRGILGVLRQKKRSKAFEPLFLEPIAGLEHPCLTYCRCSRRSSSSGTPAPNLNSSGLPCSCGRLPCLPFFALVLCCSRALLQGARGLESNLVKGASPNFQPSALQVCLCTLRLLTSC